MKNLLLILFLMIGFGLNAQQSSAKLNPDQEDKLIPTISKMNGLLSHFSIVATAGTSSLNTSQLKKTNFRQLSKLSLSELSINIKTNSRLSFGLGTMGNISNCSSSYRNSEGTLVKIAHNNNDDSNDNDSNDNDVNDTNEPNDTNGPDDVNDTDNDQDTDDNCSDDEFNNLMGNVTFKLSNKIPLFVQAAGGYSFSDRAPAYTVLIGYNQRIFSGLGVRAGIRYSDVLYSLPADAVKGSLTSTDGLKAELGLSWNF